MSPRSAANSLESDLHDLEEIAEAHLLDNAAHTDSTAEWPERGIRALQNAGFGGFVVPTKFGGRGHGLLALSRGSEILGRACASTAICFGMHCVGASVLAAQATPYQVERYLRPISEGRHLTTLALSEPGTGAHFYYPQTTLRPSSDGQIVIEGTKTFVTNGGHADSYIISVMDEDDHGATRFSCVAIDDGMPGMTWGDAWQGFGMRGNDSRALRLDQVSLPAGNLLGSEGDQIWYVFNVVAPYFLIAMSGVYLGVADAALKLVRQHLISREHTHSGLNLADSNIVQHRFATLWSKLQAVRQLVHDAAGSFDRAEDDAVIKVMVSKAEVAETATTIVNEAMSMMGGIAYRDGAHMQRLLRDVRAAHVMAPTTDLLRLWAGRMLLGRPVLGE